MKRLVKKSSKKGFTLIEMMLVVAIIVVLAAVGIIGIGSALSSAESNQNKMESEYQPKIDAQASNVRNVLKK